MVSRGTICKTAWAVLRGLEEEETAGDRLLALHPPANLTSAVETEKGRTPLHHAAAATRLPVVYELIKAGADVHIRWLK